MSKANNFNNQLREAKAKLKSETEMQRRLMTEVKQKHTEILKLETRQKLIQHAVKAQKDKGHSPRSSKQALDRQK